jgi:hypothetical protein
MARPPFLPEFIFEQQAAARSLELGYPALREATHMPIGKRTFLPNVTIATPKLHEQSSPALGENSHPWQHFL